MTIKHGFVKPLWLILASYFRTTVRNGYNTVLLDQIYVNLRILTYIVKWYVPCLVNFYLGPQVIWGFAIFKSDENGSMDKIFETRCVLKLELTLSFGNRIVKDFSVHGSVWEDKS